MKKTTTEQFNEWLEKINGLKKEKVFCYSHISAIYGIDKIRGAKIEKPTKWNVEGIHYETKNNFGVFPKLPVVKKRATAKNVESAKHHYEELLRNGEILFYVKRNTNYGWDSYYICLEKIDNNYYSFDEDDLNESIKRHNEEYHKLYEPRPSFTACEHCGRQTPNDRLVREKIIYQDYKNGKKCVANHDGVFCSEECAHNEQCSREG